MVKRHSYPAAPALSRLAPLPAAANALLFPKSLKPPASTELTLFFATRDRRSGRLRGLASAQICLQVEIIDDDIPKPGSTAAEVRCAAAMTKGSHPPW